MSASELSTEPPSSAPEQEAISTEANIAELATGWVHAAGSRIKATAELALAETRLAVMSVVLMLLLSIVAAVFVLGAWGLLIAGIVTGLMQLGVPAWMTMLALGIVHVVCAWVLLRWMGRLSVHLELPATRRQLRGDDAMEESDGLA